MAVRLQPRFTPTTDIQPSRPAGTDRFADDVRLSLQKLHAVERSLTATLTQVRVSLQRCERVLASLDAGWLEAAPIDTTQCTSNGLTVNRLRARPLTVRESEVVQLIAAGLSNRQIAERLYLSPRTVERHIANLYRKLDVHSKAEAMAYVWNIDRA